MEHQSKKRLSAEKKLSTILKSESLDLTMRHRTLIKAERPKDGKSFVIFKVDTDVLVPKISEL